MSIYQEELLLRSKDVDMFRRLRTSQLFRLLQEASIRHTEELGMGRDKTLDKGILWVLLQRAEITRMPEYDERLVLKSYEFRDLLHVPFSTGQNRPHPASSGRRASAPTGKTGGFIP